MKGWLVLNRHFTTKYTTTRNPTAGIISMASINDLLLARYGGESPHVSQSGNPVIQTLLQHRSVRTFLPDALDSGVVELLIAAAQSAPSSSNLQPWSVVVVEDKARKARLAALALNQEQIHIAPVLFVWLADLSRLRRVAAKVGETASGLDYLESFEVGVIDATLAAQNTVVAAESLGLGTVYIGALRAQPEKVAEELSLPPEVFPIFGLVIGKPDPAKPTFVKPRLPQRAVLHREHYSVEVQNEAIEAYDRILQVSQTAQGIPAKAWTKQAAARIKGPEALDGRARLTKAITNRGFKLG